MSGWGKRACVPAVQACPERAVMPSSNFSKEPFRTPKTSENLGGLLRSLLPSYASWRSPLNITRSVHLCMRMHRHSGRQCKRRSGRHWSGGHEPDRGNGNAGSRSRCVAQRETQGRHLRNMLGHVATFLGPASAATNQDQELNRKERSGAGLEKH